jgi:hypothetical protein
LFAGRTYRLPIEVTRDNYHGPVQVTLRGPDRAKLGEATLAADASRVEVPVRIDAAVKPGAVTLEIEVSGDGVHDQRRWDVTVKPAPWLPNGFNAVGEDSETDATGRDYYKKIAWGKGADAIVFVLVPRRTGEPQNVPTFYLMRDKMSRKAWAELTRDDPTATPLLPVLDKTCGQALAVAEMLGGTLPTAAQWDKAFDERGAARGGVAVNLRVGPRAVGGAGDVSGYGATDMAGNGWELTRTVLRGRAFDDLGKTPGDMDRVVLRGQSWRAPAPLTSERLRELREPAKVLTQYYGKSNRVTGFRVVLAVPAP